MKLISDFLPIVLFFIAYEVRDIYFATAVAIAASVVLIAWTALRGRRVEPMQWATLLIIVVFGGLTLLLRDETFIKWKPTVLYGLFAAVLAGGRMMFGRNLVRSVMGKQLALPEPVWHRLNLAWIAFFVAMAALNLAVAYRFPTDVWVDFKLFGTMGLTIAFVIAQALWLGRYVQEEG